MTTASPSAPPPPSPSLLARAAGAARSAARAAAVGVLRAGPVPAHVAFIMDGNRRYAEGGGLDAVAGHEAGYLKVGEMGGGA
jgi:undecaprenyl pyrophosphate synthase